MKLPTRRKAPACPTPPPASILRCPWLSQNVKTISNLSACLQSHYSTTTACRRLHCVAFNTRSHTCSHETTDPCPYCPHIAHPASQLLDDEDRPTPPFAWRPKP